MTRHCAGDTKVRGVKAVLTVTGEGSNDIAGRYGREGRVIARVCHRVSKIIAVL